MNKLSKFVRFALALVFAFGAIGFSASIALAMPPVNEYFPYSATVELTDVCAFPITVDVVLDVHSITFFDNNGIVTRINSSVREQDTFIANGTTLVGNPFTYEKTVTFDSNGNYASFYYSGLVEIISLPDGSLFISAGRIDRLDQLDTALILTPDMGHSGDIDAFCAALAP